MHQKLKSWVRSFWVGIFCDRYTSDRRRAHCFISHNPFRDNFGVADHAGGGETTQYKRVCRDQSGRIRSELPGTRQEAEMHGDSNTIQGQS
jgi:hypothetical protein